MVHYIVIYVLVLAFCFSYSKTLRLVICKSGNVKLLSCYEGACLEGHALGGFIVYLSIFTNPLFGLMMGRLFRTIL